jgi:flagellar FliL protein
MAKAPASKAPKKEKNPPPPDDDDDDPKKGGEKEEAAPKGGLNLKLIIMIVGARVVGLGGGAVVMKLMGGSHPAPVAEAPAEAPAAEGEHGAPPVAPQRSGGHGGGEAAPAGGHGGGGHGGGGGGEEGPAGPSGPVNIEFQSFIVNLNDLGGKRMLKLTMSVEAENQELADEINAKMPQFRDIILLLLSSIQSDDVSGIDGKQRLKNQMLNRINPNLTKGKVRNLYFSEIVVQ